MVNLELAKLGNRQRDVALLASLLGGAEGHTRLVGGCVRDGLLGLPINDIDLATRLLPEEVMERLKAAKIKVIPTGLAHGTVTAVTHGHPVEITTLRRDVSTDGRHATIAYTDDWQEDAARRDFTINALSADMISGEVYDYFGGLDDLEARTVRFIGDANQRIKEDHLRILRFFRFHARFGSEAIDETSLNACATHANSLMALSRERIADELFKLLSLPNPAPTIQLMLDQGIFLPVLPEIGAEAPVALARLVEREQAQGVPGDPTRRLAALLPPDPDMAFDIANRLKCSNHRRKRLSLAAGRVDSDNEDTQALAYWLGPEAAIDRLLLGQGDSSGLLNWTKPTFPLSGKDVISSGIAPGPSVALVLKAVETRWVSSAFPEMAQIQQILTEEVKSAVVKER
jgi:poly(A) polymerase